MPAYQGLADRLLAPWTDAAIAVSGSTREFLVAASATCPRERVRLIWNGAPLDEFAPVARERALRVRRELGLAESTRSSSARSAGSTRRRGTGTCSTPRRACSASVPRARFVIVGDGDLLQRAARPGRAARDRPALVVFAGHRTDVPDLLGALDVFCLSSLYEGTPLALFEAMAVGQGDRVDRRRRLPRGAAGRRHGPAGPARRRRRPLAEALAARAGVDDALRAGSRGTRARGVAALRRARVRRRDAAALRRAARRAAAREAAAASWPGAQSRRGRSRATSLLRRYPAFVTGGALQRGEVPVFVLPRRRAGELRPQAARTSPTTATSRCRRTSTWPSFAGERPAPERAVLLTFDDGRGSVWSVAAPLLRRHGMKADGVPRPRPHALAPAPGPTLDDAARDLAGRPVDLLREHGEAALMSWEEVEALARDGLFDFQSHTLRHARVHTAPQLAGFATPWSRDGYDAFDQPLVRAGERDLLGERGPARHAPAPLRAARVRVAALLRGRGAARAPASSSSRTTGARASSRARDWRARLREALRGVTPVRGREETPDERVRGDQRRSWPSRAALIEARTGRPVVHLCYPWHAAGPTARRLAAEAGYETAFCGKVDGVPVTLAGRRPAAASRGSARTTSSCCPGAAAPRSPRCCAASGRAASGAVR